MTQTVNWSQECLVVVHKEVVKGALINRRGLSIAGWNRVEGKSPLSSTNLCLYFYPAFCFNFSDIFGFCELDRFIECFIETSLVKAPGALVPIGPERKGQTKGACSHTLKSKLLIGSKVERCQQFTLLTILSEFHNGIQASPIDNSQTSAPFWNTVSSYPSPSWEKCG